MKLISKTVTLHERKKITKSLVYLLLLRMNQKIPQSLIVHHHLYHNLPVAGPQKLQKCVEKYVDINTREIIFVHNKI